MQFSLQLSTSRMEIHFGNLAYVALIRPTAV